MHKRQQRRTCACPFESHQDTTGFLLFLQVLCEQPFSDNPFCLVAVVAALADVSEVVEQLQGSLIKMENFQKLLELKKDLIGIDNLVVPGRVSERMGGTFSHLGSDPLKSDQCSPLLHCLCQEFIRLGCLSKLSGKGLQQRMFFLVGLFCVHHSGFA